MTKKVILCLVITMFICVSYAACMDWMEEASISKDCPPDKPFHFDAYGYKCGEKPQSVHSENYKCLSCFEEKPIPIKKGHKKDFEICTNRETIKKGYDWSILKKCPKERPLKSWDDGCVECDTKKWIFSPKGKEDCDVCGDMRKMSDKDKEYCILAKSPDPDRPLLVHADYETFLFSCEENEPLSVSKDNCDLCPNRRYYETSGYCSLLCPEESPIATKQGCRSYDEKAFILLDPKDCEKFLNYILVDDVCILKGYSFVRRQNIIRRTKCQSIYFATGVPIEERPSQKEYLSIFDCMDNDEIEAPKEFCDLCSNREYKDEWCILKENR